MDFPDVYASPLIRSSPSWKGIHVQSHLNYLDVTQVIQNESHYASENIEPSPSGSSSALPIAHFSTPSQGSTTLFQQHVHQASVTPKKSDLRRGRPRADAITHLILKGSTSKSNIKCPICARVFPREKSLQAHLRTHTGEKPYICDYPGCTKGFAQSGQLKTHQRLHAGEKPFCCTAPGCFIRFTHANRHCPNHPHASLRRSKEIVLQPTLTGTENKEEVMAWLERYKRDRETKSPAVCGERSDCEDKENGNFRTTPTAPRKFKSRKNLELTDKFSPYQPLEEFHNYYSSPSEASNLETQEVDGKVQYEIIPLKDRNRNVCVVGVSQDEEKRFCMPKKRWLREASRQMAQQISEAVVSEDSSSADYSASSNMYFVSMQEDPHARVPSPIQPPVVLDPSSHLFDQGIPDTTSNDMLGAMALVALRSSSVLVSPPRNESPLNLTVPTYH